MWHLVALVGTDVSEERIASIVKVNRVSEIGILGETGNCRHIPKDGILDSHCRENLRSYIALAGWAMLWAMGYVAET
jgi:hypothetical protein